MESVCKAAGWCAIILLKVVKPAGMLLLGPATATRADMDAGGETNPGSGGPVWCVGEEKCSGRSREGSQ